MDENKNWDRILASLLNIAKELGDTRKAAAIEIGFIATELIENILILREVSLCDGYDDEVIRTAEYLDLISGGLQEYMKTLSPELVRFCKEKYEKRGKIT